MMTEEVLSHTDPCLFFIYFERVIPFSGTLQNQAPDPAVMN